MRKAIQQLNERYKEVHKQARTVARQTLKRSKKGHEEKILEQVETNNTNNRTKSFSKKSEI